MRDVIHRTIKFKYMYLLKVFVNYYFFCLVSAPFFVNDAQFNYNYMYIWLLINCFVLYVWDYFRQSFMFGALSDIKKQNN